MDGKTGTETHLMKVVNSNARAVLLIAGFFCLGLVLDHYTCWYAAAMTGAGHGIFIPVLYSCNVVWAIACPLLIAGANTPWRGVRLAAKGIVCLYYLYFGWLLVLFDQFANFTDELKRIPREDGVFWTWVALAALTQLLIWLPAPVFAFYLKCRRAKVKEQGACTQ